ncbi:MAG: glycosyltransferase family 9 protein [Vampirovibrionales bacterium]|nr:glycosyltransferase family 9 protein [Vampirovibrionales bacterium]
MSHENPIIELVRYGAFGDLLMATATFAGLKQQGYRVRFICNRYFAPILRNNPYLDELIELEESTHEAVEASLAGKLPAERRVLLNFPTSPFGLFHPLGFPDHPIALPITEHYCREVRVPSTDELSLHLDSDVEEWGKSYTHTVLIHSQTAFSLYKNWAPDRWFYLANHLREQFRVDVKVVGSPEDPPIQGVERLESPSLLHAIAALKHCKLFIGLDSVFNHASRAVKKPSIILWGSTNPLAFGYEQNINLVNGVVWQRAMGNDGPHLKCQPCYRENKHMKESLKPVCPNTRSYPYHALTEDVHPAPSLHACMAANTVDVVFTHAAALLTATP